MSRKNSVNFNLDKDQVDLVNETADKIAQEEGFSDAEDLVKYVKDGSNAAGTLHEKNNIERVAGNFITKLQPVIYQQRILNSVGVTKVYSWVKKFLGEQLTWGNDIVFTQTYHTDAGNYDIVKWVPDAPTGQAIDSFKVVWLKDNGKPAESAYQYKKSLTLQPQNWFPYFTSGKLDVVIANITQEMEEVFTLFIAQSIQQIVKNLSDGQPQKTLALSGENGKDCKLKQIKSNAPDTFQAILELRKKIYDLTKDVNTLTIASDSSNIKSVDMDDLVIFMPKDLIAKFESGILSRLPSSERFKFEEIFNSERIIPIGVELSPVKQDTGAQTDTVINVVTGDKPFIQDNTRIVVLERRAIQHWRCISKTERQYYSENMMTQITDHQWGFTFVLPFAKGFVFQCDNLLTDPAIEPINP